MISSIRLIGCQSWEDTTIELATDRLTVIKALNNVGKSVLFKMLKISAHPKQFNAKKRKKLIRWGHDYATILYLFTDGCMGGTYVYPTKVMYVFKEADSEEWVNSYEPDPRMIERLGLIVNEEGSFIANIIDTDQSLLLVDTESANTVEFLNMLCNNARLDEYKEKASFEYSEVQKEQSRLLSKLLRVQEDLSRAQRFDVERMENELNRCIEIKEVLYALVQVAYDTEPLQNIARLYRDYDGLICIADTLRILEELCLSSIVVRKQPPSASVLEVLEVLEGMQLCSIAVRKKPPSASVLEVLEVLEGMQLRSIAVRKKPPSTVALEVLEVLEGMQLRSITVRKQPPSTVALEVLEVLEGLRNTVNALQESLITITNSAQKVKELEEEFLNSGAVHECSVYGKVVFDGKECVPCD